MTAGEVVSPDRGLLDRSHVWLGWVSSGLALLGSVWLAGVALLIGFDVVGRAIGRPLLGTVEIAATSVVAVTFLLLPYAMHRRSHVRSTIVRDRLPTRVAHLVDAVAYLLGAAVFVMIVLSSWDLLLRAWATGEYSGEGALRVPAYPTRTVLVLGSAVMTLECLLAAVRSVVGAGEDPA